MLRKSSVSIARDRVKALVVSDRVHSALTKYIEFTEDDFQVNINRTQVIITFAGEES